MCGRFTLTVSGRVLAELFDVDDVPELEPRYNIAPSRQVLAARTGAAGAREVVPFRWGLIPSWADDEKIGNRMINARAEGVAARPSFRSAVRHRRCLVAADGFYEWRKVAGGKQPYLIRFADGRPFAFAGLWERWQRGAEPVESCTIITTRPNDLVAELHDRMPVILARAHFAEWLAPEPLAAQRLDELLAPFPTEGMESFPVGRRVNSPGNDDPRCIEPLP